MHVIKWALLAGIFILSSVYATAQITGIKIVGDTCNSLTLDLQALGTSSSPYFFWNFGDPASGINDTITITGTSPSPFPTHTFSGPGVYTVCVSLQEPGDPVTTVCRTISIGLCCNGVIQARDTCLNNGTSFSITTTASITSVLWNFGDPASGAANTSGLLSPSHTFSGIGTYTVTASVTAPCGIFNISYPITIVNCGSTSPCSGTIRMRDSCLQNGAVFNVISSSAISSVTWSFGDPASGSSNSSTLLSPSHVFSGAGSYSVSAIVTAACGVYTAIYTATVINCAVPCFAGIVFSDSCAGNSSAFSISTASAINSINWNFGDPSSGTLNSATSRSANHKYDNPGSYNVTATVNLACGQIVVDRSVTIVNCVKELEGCSCILPGGFTPNGDGQNDVFYARSEDMRTVKNMRVYNRWGQLIYERENVPPNDVAVGWDGKYQGQLCAPDIYMYYVNGICNSGKEILVKGDVMIIR